MSKALINHILKFAKPSLKELDEFVNDFSIHKIAKKEYLLQNNQQAKFLYFIIKGCFRSFFINKKGVEKNIHFAIENWWTTDYDSFLTTTPTQLNIQALENSTVLKISKEKLHQHLDQSLELNKYFRIIQEKVRVADQRRLYFIFDFSGEEIYDHFRTHNPEFMQRVPQYMLASYLGFTPEFLSKIRGHKK